MKAETVRLIPNKLKKGHWVVSNETQSLFKHESSYERAIRTAQDYLQGKLYESWGEGGKRAKELLEDGSENSK